MQRIDWSFKFRPIKSFRQIMNFSLVLATLKQSKNDLIERILLTFRISTTLKLRELGGGDSVDLCLTLIFFLFLKK